MADARGAQATERFGKKEKATRLAFSDSRWIPVAVLRSIRKLSGRKKCGRKRCTTNRENRSLMRIVKQNRFKNLGELHKEWTEAGVKASRATTHRRVKEFGYSCRGLCPHQCRKQTYALDAYLTQTVMTAAPHITFPIKNPSEDTPKSPGLCFGVSYNFITWIVLHLDSGNVRTFTLILGFITTSFGRKLIL